VDDRLARIEMNHDKLKAHFKGIEDAMGNNQLGSRRSSGLSGYIGKVLNEDNPGSAIIGA